MLGTKTGTVERVDVAIRVAAGLAIAGTFLFSLVNPPGSSRILPPDEVMHGISYAVDTFLLLLALVWRPGAEPKHSDAWGLLVALAVLVAGGLIELLQGAVGRDAQLGDWVAEGIGISVALGAFLALTARHRALEARNERGRGGGASPS